MVAADAKVFVVDDDDAAREAMQELMESVGLGVETFSSADEFLNLYNPQCRGCVLLDVRMPGMSGLQLQEELLRRGPHLPLIFVSGHGDIPMAVETLKKGALDFIEKPFGGQTLLDRVQEALRVDAQNQRRQGQLDDLKARASLLTPREKQIAQYLMEGKHSKQIALALDLSRKTVDWHLSVIREKMGVDSTSDLILAFYKAGWLASDGTTQPGDCFA